MKKLVGWWSAVIYKGHPINMHFERFVCQTYYTHSPHYILNGIALKQGVLMCTILPGRLFIWLLYKWKVNKEMKTDNKLTRLVLLHWELKMKRSEE